MLQQLKKRCAHITAAILCIAAALAATGCSQANASAEQPLTRSELGAKQACEKGYAVEWISHSEMQCLKEL